MEILLIIFEIICPSEKDDDSVQTGTIANNRHRFLFAVLQDLLVLQSKSNRLNIYKLSPLSSLRNFFR